MSALKDNTNSIQTLIEGISNLPVDRYDEGYSTGYSEGYGTGHTEGTEQGYNTGYSEGFANGEVGISNLIQATITEIENSTVTKVKQYAFSNCTKLTKAILPNVTSVDIAAFSGCSLLETIYMPALREVWNTAFFNCKALTNVDFPVVGSINRTAFANCEKLTTLILRKTTVCLLIAADAFSGTPIANGTGFIYVPDEMVDSYKAATNWSTYADQIKPLSELGV